MLAAADLFTCILLLFSGLARGVFWKKSSWMEFDAFVHIPLATISSNIAVLAAVAVAVDRLVIVIGYLYSKCVIRVKGFENDVGLRNFYFQLTWIIKSTHDLQVFSSAELESVEYFYPSSPEFLSIAIGHGLIFDILKLTSMGLLKFNTVSQLTKNPDAMGRKYLMGLSSVGKNIYRTCAFVHVNQK